VRRSLGSVTARVLVGACAAGLMTAAGLCAQSSGATSGIEAKAARTVSLVETGHLAFVPSMERGSAIGERGRATGTYDGSLEVYLTIHPHYATAVMTVYPRGGSITGSAHADYVVHGSVGSFQGTLDITHGTGTFKHISGKLSFKGAINHLNYKMWVVTQGTARY
jgi:hypothetical protein